MELIFNPAGIDLARDPLRASVLLKPDRLERLWWAAHNGPAVRRVWELYDLETDPGEVRDVAREKPEVARELWQRLAGWLALAPAERTARRVKLEDLSPAEVETLRSLGTSGERGVGEARARTRRRAAGRGRGLRAVLDGQPLSGLLPRQ